MMLATDPAEFVRRGFRAREFFPHEVHWLAKAYPDSHLRLAARGFSADRVRAGRCLQVNVYSSRIEGLPDALFTDRQVNWHGQQLGKRGLVAAAGLFVEERAGFVTLLQSDLCQQIYRSRELRSAASARLNNRFRYWYLILLNALLDGARRLELDTLSVPTGEHVVAGTRKRVLPDLFLQIYDAAAERYSCRRANLGSGEYWGIPVAQNEDRIAPLRDAPASPSPSRKQICIVHDIEENVDTDIDPSDCRTALRRMLEIERAHGVRATYSVLGRLFRDVAPIVAAHGDHALAFHSFDHRIEAEDQLARVRAVDLQVKGYRPPRSVLTAELSDEVLALWNFEWLLSSAHSLGFAEPRLERGIVKIPVHLDDYPLHTAAQSRAAWLDRVRREVEGRDVVVIGSHDCYARHWLDGYGDLLAQLREAGELLTCEELASRLILRDALALPQARSARQTDAGAAAIAHRPALALGVAPLDPG